MGKTVVVNMPPVPEIKHNMVLPEPEPGMVVVGVLNEEGYETRYFTISEKTFKRNYEGNTKYILKKKGKPLK